MSEGTGDRRDNTQSDSDRKSRLCRALSIALSDVIRHSTNVDFRDRCFELSRSSNSSGVQTVLTADLLSILSQDDHPDHRKKQKDEAGKNTRNETSK
ncbi:hypothetical protein PUN28_002377 [Cardiocondyla obscurior]|uniref:Uncharacterized protein n=1 Tax=Cardiocondyla obscurior TaxID=286306 RepID=A0AAW2GTX2_9HYME